MNTTNISLPDWLTRCAENRPAHLAVQCGQVQWSFADLDRQATRLARQLAAAGVQEEHRVALLAANGLSYVAFVHALTRLGAILVPLNLRLTPLAANSPEHQRALIQPRLWEPLPPHVSQQRR